jgi:hypothetical protein
VIGAVVVWCLAAWLVFATRRSAAAPEVVVDLGGDAVPARSASSQSQSAGSGAVWYEALGGDIQ